MFGKRAVKPFASLNVLLVTLVLAGTALAAGVDPGLTTVYWFADGSEVQGAKSQLQRMDGGFGFHINTKGLDAGYLYTVWAVVFNVPGDCSDGVCGEDDIFNPDGSLNVTQIGAADISVIYAGGFEVNNSAGVGNVGGRVFEGFPTNPGQAFGVPFSPTGLGDSSTAEVHLIVRDHGPPQEGLSDAQMSTFGGGCNNVPSTHPGYALGVDGDYPCADVQFAVHMP